MGCCCSKEPKTQPSQPPPSSQPPIQKPPSLQPSVKPLPSQPPVQNPPSSQPPIQTLPPSEVALPLHPPIQKPLPSQPPVQQPQPSKPPIVKLPPSQPPVEPQLPLQPPIDKPLPSQPPVQPLPPLQSPVEPQPPIVKLPPLKPFVQPSPPSQPPVQPQPPLQPPIEKPLPSQPTVQLPTPLQPSVQPLRLSQPPVQLPPPSQPPVQPLPPSQSPVQHQPPLQESIVKLPPTKPPVQHPPPSQSPVQPQPSPPSQSPVQPQPSPPSQPPVQPLPPSRSPVQPQLPVQSPPPLQPAIEMPPPPTPVAFSPWKPVYPDYAIGIEEQKKQVMNLLDMETGSELSLAVVLYGFGGLGKTTLATAVIADLDQTRYNYLGVQMHVDSSRNDIKSMQQQILKDGFPEYDTDSNGPLRNSAEGRDHLIKAFQAQSNKPLFLFIDNALRAEDLKELFPKRLTGLPKRSRIVVTARNHAVTDMLKEAGLRRRDYRVGTLANRDALKILFKDENISDSNKVQKILQICDGIPLVLQIVGARLRKQSYKIERCTQIFEALETGEDIKEENLSERLVNFVYNELEVSTREAFLDICCFFANWSRRDLEYIVGAEDVTLLQEAALMKISDKDELIVHDIIRAKGRSLSKCNRIMNVQSWLDVAHEDQKLEQIKGVWLGKEESQSGHEVDEKQLYSLKNSL